MADKEPENPLNQDIEKQKLEALNRKRKIYRPNRLVPRDKQDQGEDIKEMISKIYKMHDDLNRQLEYVEKNLHIIPEKIRNAAAEPEKIIKDYDLVLKRYEEEFEEKIAQALGQNFFLAEKNKKNKKIARRGRKVQKLQARKKWIRIE